MVLRWYLDYTYQKKDGTLIKQWLIIVKTKEGYISVEDTNVTSIALLYTTHFSDLML